MRTILFWLLPIYNLVTAIALVRRVAAPGPGGSPPMMLVVLAWILAVAAVANILVVRSPAFMAVPYVLFAAIALVSWRLNARMPRRSAATASDAA